MNDAQLWVGVSVALFGGWVLLMFVFAAGIGYGKLSADQRLERELDAANAELVRLRGLPTAASWPLEVRKGRA